MGFSRRQFFHASSGALAFGSSLTLLKGVGIADTQPIKVANILDRTGGLNIYCLKQINAAAMAVDELNSAGGLLGRKIELIFYDSQSNNQLNSQYATQALVRDKVDVLHGGVTSSSREVMRPIVDSFKGLYFYNSLYEGGVCDRRHVCTGMVPAQQIEPLVDYVVSEKRAKKGYILAADYNYGQITAKWMQKFIRQRGGAGPRGRVLPPRRDEFRAGHQPHPGGEARCRLVGPGRRRAHVVLSPVSRPRSARRT